MHVFGENKVSKYLKKAMETVPFPLPYLVVPGHEVFLWDPVAALFKKSIIKCWFSVGYLKELLNLWWLLRNTVLWWLLRNTACFMDVTVKYCWFYGGYFEILLVLWWLL